MNTKKPKEKNEGSRSSVSRHTCCCRHESLFLVIVFIVWIIINCMRSSWFG